MQNSPTNFFQSQNWLRKSICLVSLTGISTLISLPVLSQLYPPMGLFQPTTIANYPYRSEDGNLVDSLNSNVNFENLAAEIEAAGLTETLQQKQFTLLAPNDDAFNALPDDVFDKFSQPENRIKVLQYHLIPGKVSQKDVEQGKITTVEGNDIAISNQDNNITLNDANAQHPSIVASNGIIIEIDRVLLPPRF